MVGCIIIRGELARRELGHCEPPVGRLVSHGGVPTGPQFLQNVAFLVICSRYALWLTDAMAPQTFRAALIGAVHRNDH